MPRKRGPGAGRGPRGSGSVFPDARRGGWVAKIPDGRRPDGRLKYRRVPAETREEAERLRWAGLPAAPTVTLAEWADRWLAALDVREQSKANYETNLRKRILPSLGARRVADVTPFDVEEAARAWGHKVGATTVRFTLATLSACLQAATRAEVTHRNAARVIKRPKSAPPPHDLFTLAELERIVHHALRDPKHHPFAVCAATGCRIGEALALDPADFDPAAGVLTIRRTVVRNRGQGRGRGTAAQRTGPPKSDNGKRTIGVDPALAPALRRKPVTMSYDTAEGRWKKFLAALGLRARGTHQMKHSVASLLVARGVPIADAAKHVGDSFAVFVRTYCHPVGHDVAGTLRGLFGSAKVAREAAESQKNKRKRRAPNKTR